MLIEAGTVERGQRIGTDICIIGCGPAGITLVKELAAQSVEIVVLESGAKDFDPDAQALCHGTTISSQYPADLLMNARRRQLGGTANLWNDELDEGKGDELVRLVALDAIDFEKRAWVTHSGWPFDRAHLEPFYERALHLGGASPFADTADSGKGKQPELFQPGARLRTMMSQFGTRTRFTREYPDELARDPNVRVFLNATLLDFVSSENTVRYARAAVAPDYKFEVVAKFFVLAAGGIENARLLLLSNGTQPNGLGNQNDLVGRFFMDHPSFRLGVFTPADRNLFRSAGLYDHCVINGARVMGKLTFRDEVMRHEELLNICVTLTPRGRGYEAPASKVLKRVINSGSATAAAKVLRNEYLSLIAGWDELLVRFYEKLVNRQLRYFENKGGWSRLEKIDQRFRRFELSCLSEQVPDPQNRVTLGEAVDRFGQREVALHWRWSDLDLRSIRRAQDMLKEEFVQHGLGKFAPQYELDGGNTPRFSSPHHHLGTTRMHINPREGVVDANGQVHGVSNLYIAGSSVFPTGGFANPTLTIIALAIRLSYHLKELMKPPISFVSGSSGGQAATGKRAPDR